MDKNFLFNSFLLTFFLFVYSVYARTLVFAFIFLLIALFIVLFYIQNDQLEQCHNKLKRSS
jgi:hypothetical protein